MQFLFFISSFAPVMLYLWLGIASFVAYRRTHSREWRLQVSTVAVFCFNWIVIALLPLLQKTQTPWWSWLVYTIYTLYPSLMIVRLPKLKNPLFVYRNRSDFLLLRQPIAVLPPGVETTSAPQRHTRTGLTLFLVSNLVLALVSIGSMELGTCRYLDIALRLSGCVGILRYNNGLQSMAFSPDGTLLALSKRDHTVEIWRVSDQTLVRAFDAQDDQIMNPAFSPDNALLATASDHNQVRLWRLKDITLIQTLVIQTPLTHITSVQFSPDSKLIAASGNAEATSSTIWFWQVSDGRLSRTLPSAGSNIVFSPDGTMLATDGKEDTIVLSRLTDGSIVRTLPAPRFGISKLAFSPDGSLLAGVAAQYSIWIWRVQDGKVLHTLSPSDNALSVRFSPDGSLLATGGFNGTVDLWRSSSGQKIQHWEVGNTMIEAVAFSPDQKTLATASSSQNTVVWEIPPH